jgi:ribosomal protein L32
MASQGHSCEHTFVPWLRCPSCSEWSAPRHWEHGTNPKDPHAVRCPSCGKWCDPSDQTMRIGERPGRDTN